MTETTFSQGQDRSGLSKEGLSLKLEKSKGTKY